MHSLNLLFAVVTLLLSQEFAYGDSDIFDCFSDCGFELFDPQDCDRVHATLDCYNSNEFCVSDPYVDEIIFDVYDAEDACAGVASSNPSVEVFNCPSAIPFVLEDPTVPMPQADLTRQPHNCSVVADRQRLRQCSMFTYSHLRSFKGYRNGIETCALPGEWYLLKHSSLTVAVESVPLEGTNSTRLTKVNVTFTPTSCVNGTSYVATFDSPMPLTFTDNLPVNNSNSALQLNHDGTVVAILATWLDATIIIRQLDDSLSVTTQVPGEISFYSEGLCRGCPAHSFVNVTSHNSKIGLFCSESQTNAVLNCFQHAGVIGVDSFEGIVNETYHASCMYDSFQTESIDTLSVFKAISQDAVLLKDGPSFVPVREVVVPPTLPPLPTGTSESPTVGEVPPSTEDTDMFGSSVQTTPFNIFILLAVAYLTVKLFK